MAAALRSGDPCATPETVPSRPARTVGDRLWLGRGRSYLLYVEATHLRDRIPLAGAVLSLTLTGLLVVRIIAIDKPGIFVILVPALAGALLALRATGRAALIMSALLTTLTAAVILIGGVGLLYLPSIVLFGWGAVASDGPSGGRSV